MPYDNRQAIAKAVTKLNELRGDGEAAHVEADSILLELLTKLGAREASEAFDAAAERTPFWYA